jgi:acyl dehydratase
MIGSGFLGDHALGAPGMKELNWYEPVRPGDRIWVEAEVLEKRQSNSNPDRGFVTFKIAMINQDDKTVMDFTVPQIIQRHGQAHRPR